MTSTTDPTVPLPTATDTDDDDDDDDGSSSLLSSQPPAATTPPAQPTVPVPAPTLPPVETNNPGSPSLAPAPTTASDLAISSLSTVGQVSASNTIRPSSATELADSLPSGTPSALSPATSTSESNSGSEGPGAGASAGIGVGVALIVCLVAFGVWFFVRRHKARRNKIRSTSSHNSDEEHAQEPPKAEVYAYRAGGPVEVPGDEKPRRWSELESPAYVAEVGDEQIFRAELPGSVMPAASAVKGENERLFTDPPIDEGSDTLETDKSMRLMEKKDHLQ